MTPEQINAYIGKPYAEGGNGPDAYDCRGLLIHFQRTYFGQNIPDLPMGDEMRDLFQRKLDAQSWEVVANPRHGDCVLLRGGAQPHVGVYVDPIGGECGVVHSLEGAGVVFTHASRLRAQGFSRVQYIRFHEGA